MDVSKGNNKIKINPFFIIQNLSISKKNLVYYLVLLYNNLIEDLNKAIKMGSEEPKELLDEYFSEGDS